MTGKREGRGGRRAGAEWEGRGVGGGRTGRRRRARLLQRGDGSYFARWRENERATGQFGGNSEVQTSELSNR